MSVAPATPQRLLATFALALLVALSVLALNGAAPAAAATCPSFKVLHDDRIGPANLPAGNYAVTTDTGLGCQAASQFFTLFLQDWDGNLPKPWRVVAEGSGKASFTRGNLPGFSVSRTSGGIGGGTSPELGRLCSGNFTVNASSQVGPLLFPKGQYLVYIPPVSGITCRRASVLFTKFLAAPSGTLPSPWRVTVQNATFFKPQNPARSAFRIEPANGA
ncbi:MAG TPA: hypothetical protein VD761_04635 [Solirubrobacterales bacterium]|nr:hypothetical protein [Solirubrobacterales bacterium]